MTDQQRAEIKELLQIIQLEEMIHKQKMAARRQQLMGFVPAFETYGEMYAFIKQNTPDLRTFCIDMNEALEIFWDKEKS